MDKYENCRVRALVRNGFTGKEESRTIWITAYYPWDDTYSWQDIGHESFIHASKIQGTV